MPVTNAPRQSDVPNKSDSFLLLDENAFAHTAVMQLRRRRPTGTGRLLYLYGPSGVGKSHLVRTYLREIRGSAPPIPSIHFTAAQFGANLADASEAKRIPDFQRQFQHVEALVCEDLGALANRYESQRQLVSLLDYVLCRGGTCLITNRLAPAELPGMSARLVNRCHAGVCAALHMPGKASRLRLLNHFAQVRQVPLTDEAAELLAAELPISPRELLAATLQVDHDRVARSGRIDARAARRFLDSDVKPRRPTLSKIVAAVARHFQIRPSEMRNSSRVRDQVLPRQCAMLLAREMTGHSLEAIAGYFGRRTHSSVIHACNRLEELASSEPALRHHLTQIRHALGIVTAPDC